MKTLRFSLAALGLAFAVLPASAATPAASASMEPGQGRPGLRRLAERRHAERGKLAERLGLSADQQEQLKARRAATAAAAKAIRDDANLTPEQKKEKLRETRRTAQTEMRSLLTPEQQAKLETMKKRGHRAAHRRTSL